MSQPGQRSSLHYTVPGLLLVFFIQFVIARHFQPVNLDFSQELSLNTVDRFRELFSQHPKFAVT